MKKIHAGGVPPKHIPALASKNSSKGKCSPKKIDVARKFPIHSPQPHNYSDGPSVIDGYRPWLSTNQHKKSLSCRKILAPHPLKGPLQTFT